MRKFLFTCIIILTFPRSVSAVDLSIKDPLVSNLEITVTASLSATSNYYLQGTLRSQSSSKYFGETQNSKGDWIDYISSPEKEYITSNFFVTDVQNATWSGQVKLRFKIDDPNYQGPGSYDLKLRRFTGGSSSSAGESNTLTINLSAPLPTSTPSPTTTPITTPTPTPNPSVLSSSSPSPKPSPLLFPSPPPSPSPLGEVAGVSDSQIDLTGFGVLASPSPPTGGEDGSPTKPTLNRTRAKTALLLGAGLIIISISGFFGYRKYRSLYNQEK